MSMNKVGTTISTGPSRRCAAYTTPSSPESDKTCCGQVADIQKVVALRPQRTNTSEQQPSSMKRVLDQKDQTCTHTNVDEQQLDPNRFTEDQHWPNPVRSNRDTPPHILPPAGGVRYPPHLHHPKAIGGEADPKEEEGERIYANPIYPRE